MICFLILSLRKDGDLGQDIMVLLSRFVYFSFISDISANRPRQSRDSKCKLNILDPHGTLFSTVSWIKSNYHTSVYLWNISIRNNYGKFQFVSRESTHLFCRNFNKRRKLVLLLLACCGDISPNPGPNYSRYRLDLQICQLNQKVNT